MFKSPHFKGKGDKLIHNRYTFVVKSGTYLVFFSKTVVLAAQAKGYLEKGYKIMKKTKYDADEKQLEKLE